MNPRRIATLAWRIILQFRRDRRTLGMIAVAPVVILALLAYLIRLSLSPIPLGLAVEDTGPGPQRLADELGKLPVFESREIESEDAERLIESGDLEAAVVIPEGYSERLLGRDAPDLEIIVDGSRSRTEPAVLQGISLAISRIFISEAGAVRGAPRVTYVHAGPQFELIDYFAPTFVAFFAFFFVYLLTAIGFLRERTQGTLERLLASPLTKAEMVLGYMVGFSLFALLQSAVILLFTVYVIGIHYVGNLLIVFLIVAVMAMGAVNMGIFLSTFARTELQAVQFIPVVITPQALLAGIFWPIPDMHVVFQWIAHVMPLTYANFALQEVMVKGEGIVDASVAADVGALLLFAAIQVFLASIALRRAST